MSLRPLFGATSLALAAALLSCGSAETKIQLSDPNELKGSSRWIEFNVFEDGCPSEEELADGTYGEPFKSQVVDVEEELGSVGTLDAKEYGFAVLLRDEQCAIVGYGCTKANIKTVRTINIKVNPTYTDEEGNPLPKGACEAPAVCDTGRCTDDGGEGGAGGSSGSGGSAGSSTPRNECKKIGSGSTSCKMELVGWGDLPQPSAKGAQLGSPAVVSTPKGFVVGYHEMYPDGTRRRISLLAVGTDGCYPTPVDAREFTDECAGAPFDPTLGAAWNPAGQGAVIFGRQACPAQNRGGGVGLVTFNADGAGTNSGAIDRLNEPTFPMPKLSGGRSLIVGQPTEDFLAAYTMNNASALLGIKNLLPTAVLSDVVSGGTETLTNPLFALGDNVDGLFVTASSGTLPDSSQGTLLKMVKGASAQFAKRPAAKQLTLRAYGDRVVTLSRSATDQLEWAVVNSAGAQLFPDPVAKPDANELLPIGTATAGFDVAHVNDRLIFAVGQSNGLQLAWFIGASGSPSIAGGSPIVVSSSNLPPLANFDGKQLAMAAGSNRVAVAWINQATGTDSPVGGVAVFKCE